MRVRALPLVIVFFLALLHPLLAWGDPHRLVRIGAFNYYPAIFQGSDGRVQGFYVDMLEEVARRESWRIEYVYGTWNDGLERMRKGEVDLLTSVAYTDERARYMAFGRTPLLTVWGELYVKRDSELRTLHDIVGKKIAVMRGDFNARRFMEQMGKFGFSCHYIEVEDFDHVFEAVRGGKADAGVANALFGEARQEEYALKSTGFIFNPFDIYFTAPVGQADLLEVLDGYLDSWRSRKDSPYQQARLRWSHGEKVEVLPAWVYRIAAALLAMVAAGSVFVLLLRRQVRRATETLAQREETLRDSHEAYQAILETAHDGFWETGANGEILEVNDTYVRLSGFSRKELLQMRISDLEACESEEMTAQRITRLMAAGSDLFESVHRRKDGSTWDVEVSCRYTPSRCGRFFVFLRDITKRKKDENALRETNAELERFMYTVSHDLKSPLVTIRTFLGYLRQDQEAGDRERIEADLNYLQAASLRMEKLLDDLLQMSRIGRVFNAPVRVGFNDLVDEAVSAVAGRIAERQVDVRVDRNSLLLFGDRHRLAQIWQNLIENAVKYMGSQPCPRVEVGVEGEGKSRLFFVRDNGLGISPEEAGSVFDLFKKLDHDSEGSGLGLALVKRIVEMHGGEIRLQSEGLGRGSCFLFTLPGACEPEGAKSR